jgi:hypothetical protein
MEECHSLRRCERVLSRSKLSSMISANPLLHSVSALIPGRDQFIACNREGSKRTFTKPNFKVVGTGFAAPYNKIWCCSCLGVTCCSSRSPSLHPDDSMNESSPCYRSHSSDSGTSRTRPLPLSYTQLNRVSVRTTMNFEVPVLSTMLYNLKTRVMAATMDHAPSSIARILVSQNSLLKHHLPPALYSRLETPRRHAGLNAVKVKGQNDNKKPPLILLHGFGSGLGFFFATLPHLVGLLHHALA